MFFILLILRLIQSSSDKSCYCYKTPINITHSGGSTLTSTDILITLNTYAMVINGSINQNCDDLLFYDIKLNQTIDYWIENGCNKVNTNIWVTINGLEGNEKRMIELYSACNEVVDNSVLWDDGVFVMYSKRDYCGEGATFYPFAGNNFIKGANEESVSITQQSNLDHMHSFYGISQQSSASGVGYNHNEPQITVLQHDHDHMFMIMTDNNETMPPYETFYPCANNILDLYNDTLSIWIDSIPSNNGYRRYDELDGKFVMGNLFPNQEGGNEVHKHSFEGDMLPSLSNVLIVRRWNYFSTVVNGTNTFDHDHFCKGETSESSNIPQYISVIFGLINNEELIEDVSRDQVFLVTNLPPKGYEYFTNFTGKYLRGSDQYGVTGNENGISHSHSATGFCENKLSTRVNYASYWGYKTPIDISHSNHSHEISIPSVSHTEITLPTFNALFVRRKKTNDDITISISDESIKLQEPVYDFDEESSSDDEDSGTSGDDEGGSSADDEGNQAGDDDDESGGGEGIIIALIVVFSVFIVLAIVAIVIYFILYRSRKKKIEIKQGLLIELVESTDEYHKQEELFKKEQERLEKLHIKSEEEKEKERLEKERVKKELEKLRIEHEKMKKDRLYKLGYDQNNDLVPSIDHMDCKMEKEIGKCRLGLYTLHKARWNLKTVLARVFCEDIQVVFKSKVFNSFNFFEQEIIDCATYEHPNILKYYAFSPPPYVLVVNEFCERGTLQILFQKNSASLLRRFSIMKREPIKIVTLQQRIEIMKGILQGMLYIHERTHHGDLRSEYIFIKKDLTPKIDFSFNRTFYQRYEYSHYAAPEIVLKTLKDKKIIKKRKEHVEKKLDLKKADIFSFGIIMYELLTENFNPYGVDKSEIGKVKLGVRASTDPNFRPKLNERTAKKLPNWWVNLMKMCWNHYANERPSFERIQHIINVVTDQHKDDDDDK